ncbi:MarR family transcriptional regulator [Crenobacter sp. SG2305]|uniref:MarR family winged helix-turn-helix transcriptional regulator n=1 Tax=Crenobacter oryzisoli TaxID=3056844 RepID=UPI0025AA539D|nr:MarR family transcriptional regulator [Crenobacter sp. SG2305]MDN0085341.1 MarR family transcriptional regulator [Crenobacter sp. SG2305]
MASQTEAALLRQVMYGFFAEQRQQLTLANIVGSHRLLLPLARHEPMSQTELGRLVMLEKSWVSRAIDRLVAQGWVNKAPSRHDGRVVELTLSAAGRKEAARIEALLDEHATTVLERLDDDQRAALVSAMRALAEAVLPARVA